MKELCKRLSEATDLRFQVDDDTCEPAANGEVLNYWLTSYKDVYHLVANSIYEEVFSGHVGGESDLIAKINELENDFRYV
jgi:hypothetical protein